MQQVESEIGMSATIYDIARLTGYNPGTVSRALNNDPRVKEKTREKIREVGNLLGYVPNLAAKSLITGRTQIIAVVSGSWSGGPMTSLMLGLNKVLIQRGYLLMSLIYNNLEQFRMCLSRLKCGFCDGAILLSPPQEFASAPEFDQLEKSGYPVVCFDQWIPGKNLPVVSNDAEQSIGLLSEKLLENGMDAAYLNFQPNTVADWRRRSAEKLLRRLHIPYTCDLEKIPELFRKHRIRNFGIYSDSSIGLDLVEPKLPKKRDFRCLGGIFDSWHKSMPKYFSHVFLCEQDFDGESEAAVKILFDMMNGGKPSPEPVFYPPKEILIP